MAFKTSATFGGRKAFVGGLFVIKLDPGDGAALFPGVICEVDETNGLAKGIIGLGDADPPVAQVQSIPFDATANSGGDPEALTTGKWMWLQDANIS